MTMDNFDNIRAAIKSAWPSYTVMPDVASVKLWYGELKDLDYEVVKSAIMEMISTEKHPPSIAQIREACVGYAKEPGKSAGEAWDQVIHIVHKYGWPREEEAVAAMDDLTRKTLDNVGFKFQDLCRMTQDNKSVMRSQFTRVYNTLLERERKERLLPPVVAMNKQRVMEAARGKYGDAAKPLLQTIGMIGGGADGEE